MPQIHLTLFIEHSRHLVVGLPLWSAVCSSSGAWRQVCLTDIFYFYKALTQYLKLLFPELLCDNSIANTSYRNNKLLWRQRPLSRALHVNKLCTISSHWYETCIKELSMQQSYSLHLPQASISTCQGWNYKQATAHLSFKIVSRDLNSRPHSCTISPTNP